ncbi:glycine betaine ABC transporter substrate-binding protein [Cupriavidus basilensis]
MAGALMRAPNMKENPMMHFITSALARAARGQARMLASLAVLATLGSPGAAGACRSRSRRRKNFTEQLILSSMTSQYLQAKGPATELTSGLGSTLMRQAMESGQLDVVWDYTGTALIVFNKVEEKLEARESYERVGTLDAARGLMWLDASGINNTYALAMPRKRAEAAGVTTLSAFAGKMQAAAEGTAHPFAVDMEFAARPDGLEPLKTLYKLPFSRRDVIQLDPGLVYTALERTTRSSSAWSTPPMAASRALTSCCWRTTSTSSPQYNAVPVVRKAMLDKHPELAGLLNALSAKLDNEAMTEMNYKVDIGQQPVDKVAQEFLRGHGLI